MTKTVTFVSQNCEHTNTNIITVITVTFAIIVIKNRMAIKVSSYAHGTVE